MAEELLVLTERFHTIKFIILALFSLMLLVVFISEIISYFILKKGEKKEKKYLLLGTKIRKIGEKTGLVIGIISIVAVILTYLAFNDVIKPETGFIQKVDYKTESINLVAYYETDYKELGKKVLTLFIQNPSDKIVISAKIVEENTNTITNVEYLHPTEEKIITMIIDSKDNVDYNFKIEELESVDS